MAPDATLIHGCNYGWWARRWAVVKDLPAEKWTTARQAADEFGINWIAEKTNFGCGLSEDPQYLNHGHGSGFQLIGMAYRARPARIVLLGYDLAYAPDYDGRLRQIGSSPRHFFGEYEPELQHWPSKSVHGGRHVELIAIYSAIADWNNGCEFVNCTPGSALTALPMMRIEDL